MFSYFVKYFLYTNKYFMLGLFPAFMVFFPSSSHTHTHIYRERERERNANKILQEGFTVMNQYIS